MAEKLGTAISRREFARRAAIASAFGSAVASVAPAAVVGGELASAVASPQSAQTPPSTPTAAPAQTQLPANLPKLSPESQAEADARLRAILAQYGARFTEEQKTDLGRLCAVAQLPLDRLRAYPVQNADGTALYLKPLFEREKKPKLPAASKPARVAAPAIGTAVAKP